MSYFVSKEVESSINHNLRDLILEKEKVFNSLSKHQKELVSFRKNILLSVLNKYFKKLELLIAKEELICDDINVKINLYQEINAKIKNLKSSLYTVGDDKSIYNQDIYYECMDLYQKLCLDLNFLCEKKVDVNNLEEINDFLQVIYNYYRNVNFSNPNFDFHTSIIFDDYNLLFKNSDIIDLICYCFKNQISYDEFILLVKKYLTVSESASSNIRVKKICRSSI